MSRHEVVAVACRKCRRESAFTYWSSLNVTLDPGEKQRMHSGDLFRMMCAHCGETSTVVAPLLYHDMELRLMIWFLPPGERGEAPAEPEGPVGRSMEGYTFRVVRSLNALLEKAAAFDARLDDVVLEVWKRALIPGVRADVPDATELWFGGLTTLQGGADDGVPAIRFVVLRSGGASLDLVMRREAYDDVVARLPPPGRRRPRGRWPIVDVGTIEAIVNTPARPGLPPPARPPAPPGEPRSKPGLFARLFGRR